MKTNDYGIMECLGKSVFILIREKSCTRQKTAQFQQKKMRKKCRRWSKQRSLPVNVQQLLHQRVHRAAHLRRHLIALRIVQLHEQAEHLPIRHGFHTPRQVESLIRRRLRVPVQPRTQARPMDTVIAEDGLDHQHAPVRLLRNVHESPHGPLERGEDGGVLLRQRRMAHAFRIRQPSGAVNAEHVGHVLAQVALQPTDQTIPERGEVVVRVELEDLKVLPDVGDGDAEALVVHAELRGVRVHLVGVGADEGQRAVSLLKAEDAHGALDVGDEDELFDGGELVDVDLHVEKGHADEGGALQGPNEDLK